MSADSTGGGSGERLGLADRALAVYGRLAGRDVVAQVARIDHPPPSDPDRGKLASVDHAAHGVVVDSAKHRGGGIHCEKCFELRHACLRSA
jgi:hypothetical protein